MRAAVTAAAEIARSNQNTSDAHNDSGDASGSAHPKNESAFTTEVCDTSKTYTNICSVCFNADVTTGLTQLEEANLTYMSKMQTIPNLNCCVGHIAHKRLQHLVENGQWSWTHASKPVNFASELPSCPYDALVKEKRSSFTKPITIPDQVGGPFFADAQGLFEVESMEGSVESMDDYGVV